MEDGEPLVFSPPASMILEHANNRWSLNSIFRVGSTLPLLRCLCGHCQQTQSRLVYQSRKSLPPTLKGDLLVAISGHPTIRYKSGTKTHFKMTTL